jgi:type IV pilus assembly protein PilN
MRITVNLASKPFIELRPLYARLRWWMAILVIAAIPLWLLLKAETRKATLANAKLQSVEAGIQRLQNQQQSYQAMMRQPQNAAVLTQAAFLNQLFARKAFSWTAIMMDLETVLPGGVQVMNIDPVTDKSGNVTIRLRVSGQRDRAVELVRNLEHSRRFLQPRLASESAETNNGSQANFQPASGPANVNFDVLADYNPLEPRDTPKKPAKDDSGPPSAAARAETPKTSTIPKHAAPARPGNPAAVPTNRQPNRSPGGAR